MSEFNDHELDALIRGAQNVAPPPELQANVDVMIRDCVHRRRRRIIAGVSTLGIVVTVAAVAIPLIVRNGPAHPLPSNNVANGTQNSGSASSPLPDSAAVPPRLAINPNSPDHYFLAESKPSTDPDIVIVMLHRGRPMPPSSGS